ncbi:MAG: hypothetical protein J6T78_09615, partial [Bacteroidaceae bacterium]|nr:hypothetical protein [Bacteroidaceae bacterium]
SVECFRKKDLFFFLPSRREVQTQATEFLRSAGAKAAKPEVKMLIFSPVGFQIRQNKATIAIVTLVNRHRHTSKLQTSH